MTTLYERDEAVIAGIEKLRFFPLEVVSGHGSTLVDPDGRELVYRAWEPGAVVYYVGGNVLADAAAGKVDAQEVAKYAGW